MWVTSSYVNGQALERLVLMSLWRVNGHSYTQRLPTWGVGDKHKWGCVKQSLSPTTGPLEYLNPHLEVSRTQRKVERTHNADQNNLSDFRIVGLLRASVEAEQRQ